VLHANNFVADAQIWTFVNLKVADFWRSRVHSREGFTWTARLVASQLKAAFAEKHRDIGLSHASKLKGKVDPDQVLTPEARAARAKEEDSQDPADRLTTIKSDWRPWSDFYQMCHGEQRKAHSDGTTVLAMPAADVAFMASLEKDAQGRPRPSVEADRDKQAFLDDCAARKSNAPPPPKAERGPRVHHERDEAKALKQAIKACEADPSVFARMLDAYLALDHSKTGQDDELLAIRAQEWIVEPMHCVDLEVSRLLVLAWLRSGLDRAEFCRKNGLLPGRFAEHCDDVFSTIAADLNEREEPLSYALVFGSRSSTAPRP
jgi:hypothetical protein